MSQNIVSIPDAVCEKAGVAGVYYSFDKISIFPSRHVTAHSKDVASELAPCDTKIHHIKPSVSLFHPKTRKIINESFGIFQKIQNLSAQIGGADLRMELLKYSQQYRSVVHAYMEELRIEGEESEGEEREICNALVAVLYNVALLWHFCEILYVNAVPGDAVLTQILEWIRTYFFKFERCAAEILHSDFNDVDAEMGGAENIPNYWDTVTGLVLQGRLDLARNLLYLHSAFQTNAFQTADLLLRTMPEFDAYTVQSVSEFTIRWKAWQDSCRQKIKSGMFSSRRELELIMKVVSGHTEALEQVRHLCETWYCYMAAMLLYTDPTVKLFDLIYHANKCINIYGVSKKLREMDIVLLALMESDLDKVIRLISQFNDHTWFATHISNLLYHCGCFKIIDEEQMNIPYDVHETLLLNYGTLLMSHKSLWQVGICYLEYCSSERQAHLEVMLSHIPLVTGNKVARIIQFAEKRNMDDLVSSIRRVMAVRSYQEQCLGSALTWSLLSKDFDITTFLANKIMETYIVKGEFRADLLDHLGSSESMFVSDRLAFLGKYYEFHQLCNSGDFRDAGSYIVKLLSSKLVPKYFWLTLFMDILPLLESDDIIFSSDDTSELINCLAELYDENGIDTKALQQLWKVGSSEMEIESDSRNVLEEKFCLIQLALSKNLARALNYEDCSMVA